MTSSFGRGDGRTSEPPVSVAWPSNTVSLEDKFHYAVLSGKLQKMKELVSRGVNVDALNEDGQTPLFCAAYKGLTEVVGLLLSFGAKPNARCQPDGYTAVHGACYYGCTQILKMLLQAGGDLRICDHKRRTPIAWSLLQTDTTKLHTIRNVIESARICTTETSGMEMLKEMHSSLSPRTSSALGEVVRSIFRKSVVRGDSKTRLGIHVNMDELNNGIHHTGFGKVYFGNGERCAAVIGLPYISEVSDLEDEKNDEIPSWLCGKFTAFSPKTWTSRKTQVSVRELFTKSGPHCIPDILISELEVRNKLHHPNLLMLLGVCQTSHCDSISLVYERVSLGSLYSVLHIEQKQLSPKFATDLIIQMCDALEYVHSMKIIHCGFSSHSIILVSGGVAKLSGFEYSLPENVHSQAAVSVRHPILTSDAHLSVLRHWMAPEVLLKQHYSVKGDIYSLTCVMWELCTLDVPWRSFSLQSLRHLFSSHPAEPLPLNKSTIPSLWYHVMTLGLTPRKQSRDLDIAEIKDMMLLSKTPQAIQGSRASLYGSRRASVASVMADLKYPEVVVVDDEDDGVDVVDVADFYAPNGRVFRSTSTTSLPQNKNFNHSGGNGRPQEGRIGEPSPALPRRSSEVLLDADSEIGLAAERVTEKMEKNDSLPQGILKKFGVTKQSKSSIGEQAMLSKEIEKTLGGKPPQVNNKKKAVQEAKETQTESESVPTISQLGTPPEGAPVISADIPSISFAPTLKSSSDILKVDCQSQTRSPCPDETSEGIVVKPRKIGAIHSLGMGWSKPNTSTEKSNRGTQTEVRTFRRRSFGGSSPSPVHSPASASTPLWTSFNSSRGPIDLVIDPESKAARENIREKLNKILEMRQAGDFPRQYGSLKLPKKASFVKPASHCLEGVSSSVAGNPTEVWNYMACTSAVSSLFSNSSGGTGVVCSKGDKIFAPAIKPAGHSVTLDRHGMMVAQKSKSNLDLPTAVREEMVPEGFVFETVDKFNTFSKGTGSLMRRCFSYSRMPDDLRRAVFQPQRYFSQPLDFQKQRVSWSEQRPNRNDGGDGNIVSMKRGLSLDTVSISNPFQPTTQSIAIQCALSPCRDGEEDYDLSLNPNLEISEEGLAKGQDHCGEKQTDVIFARNSPLASASATQECFRESEKIAIATVNSLMKNMNTQFDSDYVGGNELYKSFGNGMGMGQRDQNEVEDAVIGQSSNNFGDSGQKDSKISSKSGDGVSESYVVEVPVNSWSEIPLVNVAGSTSNAAVNTDGDGTLGDPQLYLTCMSTSPKVSNDGRSSSGSRELVGSSGTLLIPVGAPGSNDHNASSGSQASHRNSSLSSQAGNQTHESSKGEKAPDPPVAGAGGQEIYDEYDFEEENFNDFDYGSENVLEKQDKEENTDDDKGRVGGDDDWDDDDGRLLLQTDERQLGDKTFEVHRRD